MLQLFLSKFKSQLFQNVCFAYMVLAEQIWLIAHVKCSAQLITPFHDYVIYDVLGHIMS